MTSPTHIPQEIIELIINELSGDRETLRKTSLVSTHFLHCSQHHLFAVVRLSLSSGDGILERAQRLLQTLRRSHIAHSIREFHLLGCREEAWPFESRQLIAGILHDIFGMLHRIERGFFSFLSAGAKQYWPHLSPTLRGAVLKFWKQPSLTSITIIGLMSFPVKLFLLFSRINSLSIQDVHGIHGQCSGLEEELNLPRDEFALEVLEIDGTFITTLAQEGVWDLATPLRFRLRGLKFVGPLPRVDRVWEVFNRIAPTLEVLQWSLAKDWYDRTLISRFYADPLDLGIMTKLRCLLLAFLADVNKYDVIPNRDWLVQSLERLAGDNRLEEITVVLIYESWNTGNTTALLKAWVSSLGPVVDGSGFPHLHRVRLLLPDHAGKVQKFVTQHGTSFGSRFVIEPLSADVSTLCSQVMDTWVRAR